MNDQLTKLEILKLVHSPQVALYTPLGMGVGLGLGLGCVAYGFGLPDPFLAGSLGGTGLAALLKIQQILEVNRVETYLLSSLINPEAPPSEGEEVHPVHGLTRVYANVFAGEAGEIREREETPVVTSVSASPLRCTLLARNGGELVTFPAWLTLPQLKFFVQRVCRERVEIRDDHLCGTRYGAHAFTLSRKRPGTLSLLREWLFARGWAEAKAPGDWKHVYRKGWHLTRTGRQKLQVCVGLLDPAYVFPPTNPSPTGETRLPLREFPRVNARGRGNEVNK